MIQKVPQKTVEKKGGQGNKNGGGTAVHEPGGPFIRPGWDGKGVNWAERETPKKGNGHVQPQGEPKRSITFWINKKKETNDHRTPEMMKIMHELEELNGGTLTFKTDGPFMKFPKSEGPMK